MTPAGVAHDVSSSLLDVFANFLRDQSNTAVPAETMPSAKSRSEIPIEKMSMAAFAASSSALVRDAAKRVIELRTAKSAELRGEEPMTPPPTQEEVHEWKAKIKRQKELKKLAADTDVLSALSLIHI